MRGAASIGGRAFRPPTNTTRRGVDPLDIVDNFPEFNELETAPILEPINDEWSISDPFEAVDPRDCSKYPASPYCENDLFAIGPPVGFEVEIRSNRCTTCVYIYPIVGFMRLTPTVICRRDPNCSEDAPPTVIRNNFNRPDRLDENVQPDPYKSPQCAFRESVINRAMNRINDGAEEDLKRLTTSFYKAPNGAVSETEYRNLSVETVEQTFRLESFNLSEEQITSGCFDNFYRTYSAVGATIPTGYIAPDSVTHKSGDTITNKIAVVKGEQRTVRRNILTGDIEWVSSWFPLGLLSKSAADFITWTPAKCCGMPEKPSIKPPPPPPPPFGRDDDRKKGDRKGGGCCMCCNSCNDSKENTDQLLREIREIRKVLGSGKLQKALNAAVGIGDDSVTGILNKLSRRIGIDAYPIEVPEALLQGQGDKVIKLQSNAEFLYWITTQMDGLIGQFPIDIEVKDIDPLKAGDQKKTITLPNIAEAIAELYGLTIKSSVNQEVELNMLLRLAAETIATKNAAVVTQDYARANANFLGYKANYKRRELQYNFDFSGANLDPKAKQPIVLENLLKTVTGYVQGWQLEDKETVVGFLQKLMFSAGIIKAVFFRGKGNQKELNRELTSMSEDDKTQQDKFEAFIKEINDPNSKYNKGTEDKPEIKDETPPDKPKGTK
ncbi:MAG: hypothetical protein DCE90_18050 [Pseudanabaena sp.]|nr:MAG: hypothetical protein DCE90_18050 [Pseudanabaena sp.]